MHVLVYCAGLNEDESWFVYSFSYFFITLPIDREKGERRHDVCSKPSQELLGPATCSVPAPCPLNRIHRSAAGGGRADIGNVSCEDRRRESDDQFLTAVLPATAKVDTAALKGALNAGELELATEREFQELFPDSDVGAMPPFGNLYELPVCAEESLARAEEIVFNAGTHEDAIG